jgi:hypothetical protein
MTDSVQNYFGQRTPTARSIYQCNFAEHQHEVTEAAFFGVHTQQTYSQTEGLARVFVTRWKTTARSDRGV